MAMLCAYKTDRTQRWCENSGGGRNVRSCRLVQRYSTACKNNLILKFSVDNLLLTELRNEKI